MSGGVFLRKKKIYAGVVGTRTELVLKGEEGGITESLLQYVARLKGGARLLGLEGGVARRVDRVVLPVCRIPVSTCCAKRRATSFTHALEGVSLSAISRVLVTILFSGRSVVVDIEGVGPPPRAVVVGRGVAAVRPRISSQEYFYDK